jgi:hypothetical protein
MTLNILARVFIISTSDPLGCSVIDLMFCKQCTLLGSLATV